MAFQGLALLPGHPNRFGTDSLYPVNQKANSAVWPALEWAKWRRGQDGASPESVCALGS